MKHDVAQLTDMIDIKMTGIFNMVNKWMPINTTIKNTLLKDIQHIKQEINNFNTREKSTPEKQCPTQSTIACRNGNSCWYLQQGRCWFKHQKITMEERNTIANRNRSRVARSLPNEKTALNTANESKKSQSRLANHHTQNTKMSNTSNNANKKQKKQKKKKKKRQKRKKKKKQNIDLILQSFKCEKIKSDEKQNENTIKSSSNVEESQLICLESPQYESCSSIIPSTYIFNTIDKAHAMINESELLSKFDGYGGYVPESEVLAQVRNICDTALENELTYEETMKQIDYILVDFI